MTSGKRNLGPVAYLNPNSPSAESFRTIRTNIQFANVDHTVKVILATSATPGEGKTYTVSNLAVVTAQAGKRVLLIDADMRKPQVHQHFQISNVYGLSDLLIKNRAINECVLPSTIPGLFLLPSGPIPINPSEMLGSRTFASLINAVRNDFDLVLIDSPPVISVADPLILTGVVDGVIFVINSQKTSRTHIRKAIRSLQQIHAKILGVVLNRVKHRRGESAYYSYYNAQNVVSNLSPNEV